MLTLQGLVAIVCNITNFVYWRNLTCPAHINARSYRSHQGVVSVAFPINLANALTDLSGGIMIFPSKILKIRSRQFFPFANYIFVCLILEYTWSRLLAIYPLIVMNVPLLPRYGSGCKMFLKFSKYIFIIYILYINIYMYTHAIYIIHIYVSCIKLLIHETSN